MSDDLTRRIQRQLDSFADGDTDADDFVRFVVKLRTQFDPPAVDRALTTMHAALANAAQRDLIASALEATGSTRSRQTTQSITGGQIAAAVAGDVIGNVYINGRWAPDERTVIDAYLRQIIGKCRALPLQGVHQQTTKTDILNISLKRVYTEAATTNLVQREIMHPQQAPAFDMAAYLRAHTGDRLLPRDLRTQVLEQTPPDEHSDDQDGGWRPFMMEMRRRGGSGLQDADPDNLQQHAAAHGIAFYGPQLATEAIAHERQLVLLGEPGSGKSTVLGYLALTLAEAGLDEAVDPATRLFGWAALGDRQRPLPLFYPLLHFSRWLNEHPAAHSTAEDMWNAIADYIDPAQSTTSLAGIIRRRLDRDELLLLLDGLDEVATPEARRKVVNAVRQFGTRHGQCRIVVTCRVRAYHGPQNSEWQLSGWPDVTLADWNRAQMTAFVHAWYHAAAPSMETEQRTKRIAAMHQALAARAELRSLGERPLLLTIMALVHLNDGRLPEDTPALLSRCIDILLAQWEDRRDDGSEYGTLMDYIGLPELTVQSLRPLLEDAAFVAHEATMPGSQGFLSRADLFQLVGKALQDLKHPNPWQGTERFLDYTDKRAGVLHANDAGDAYAFPLQTFQEYLAGRKLVSGVDPVPGIWQRLVDDRWYRPIALGIGDQVMSKNLAVPYQLLQKLIHSKDRTTDRAQSDCLLAADLGAEIGWDRLVQGDDLFERVRQDLAAQLSRVVDGTTLPAVERVRAGVYLATLGDPRSGVCTLPPTMLPIAGGTFVIGHTQAELEALRAAVPTGQRDWFDDTLNEQPVTVDPFAIGRYPVTNAQYMRFMDDDGYNPDAPWWDQEGRAWLREQRDRRAPDYWNDPRFGIARPNHPVVSVTWYEAMAFCRWLTQHLHDGSVYRLRTEAEWEWAARGWERRSYPWDDAEPDGERANYGVRYSSTTAVGCFPLGQTSEGVLDLAGNVWEWTGSVYAPYPYEPDDGREQLTSVADKRFTPRGGSWINGSIHLRAAYRSDLTPGGRNSAIGFRLATHLPV